MKREKVKAKYSKYVILCGKGFGTVIRMSVVIYDVTAEGDLAELPSLSRDALSSDRVVIVVAERQRKIYLWKGKRSSVKKKFVGARKASDLRAEWGLTFKVVAMDEGEEDGDFLNLLGVRVEAASRTAPREVAVKPPQEAAVADGPAAVAVREEKVVVEERAAAPPVRAVSRTAPSTATVAPSVQAPRGASASRPAGGASLEVNEEAVLSKLSEIEVPLGYAREIVVVGPCIYAVKETRTSIFGKESVERRLERVNPPEGVFVVENFLPRVISEGGRIVAIEFLREKSDEAGVEPLKSEMVKHLEDIISVFKGGKE